MTALEEPVSNSGVVFNGTQLSYQSAYALTTVALTASKGNN
jgi:hypothetical protein